MSDDFSLAGEIVSEFTQVGPIARAMLLQGMKESTRITFGEEALSLFGEEEESSPKGGNQKTKKMKLKWDSNKKGNSVMLQDDDLKIKTESVNGSWNGINGTPNFEKGLHYVEIQTIRMDGMHFVYFGISSDTNRNLNSHCTTDTYTCGYGEEPKWKEQDFTAFVLDNRSGTARIQFFVNGVGSGWKSTSYNENSKIYLFICLAHNIELKITNCISGEKAIDQHFKKQFQKSFKL